MARVIAGVIGGLAAIMAIFAQADTLMPKTTDKIYQKAQRLGTKPSPVFFVPNAEPPEDLLYFTVEIPKGSANKYEMRTATGQIILDRVLCPRQIPRTQKTVSTYPAHYGFSAGRFSVDQDPLDLLVFGNDQAFSKMVESGQVIPTKVRVLTVMLMEECGVMLTHLWQ